MKACASRRAPRASACLRLAPLSNRSSSSSLPMLSSPSSSASSRSDPAGGAPGETPAVRVSGLESRFGSEVIFQDLDLEVRRGEVMGVVGGSGTGKSVLLRTIVGLNRPSAGRIELLGEEP